MDNSIDTSGILRECKRIEQDAIYSAKGHFETAASWSRIHLILGCSAVVTSAIAGCLAFYGEGSFAGSVAMYSAALTSILTFLNPSELQRTHLMAGNDYKELQNKTRMFREIELNSDLEINRKEVRLRRLSEQRDRLNQRSPLIPRFAYKRGRKGIDEGESIYAVDKTN